MEHFYLYFKRILFVGMNMCMDTVITPFNSAVERAYWNLRMLS